MQVREQQLGYAVAETQFEPEPEPMEEAKAEEELKIVITAQKVDLRKYQSANSPMKRLRSKQAQGADNDEDDADEA